MIKYYVKLAFRGYLRNRKFTILILLSLITGLFVAYIGMSYIRFENSFESFHNNSDHIYRLVRTYRSQDYSVIGFPSWSSTSSEVQQLQVESLKSSPGVMDITQFIISPYSEFIKADEKQITSDGILSTNTPSGFVNMFTWNPIMGSLESFTFGNNKVLLTSSLAKRLFGPEFKFQDSLLGSLIFVGEEPYELAAVIEDVPANSHFGFEVAVSTDRIDYWGSRTYVQVDAQIFPDEVENQLNATIATFNPNLDKDELYAGHYLQPISNIHLDSNILYEAKSPGNRIYISLIGIFALLILFITLFNYANITLAIKSKASKSIGVRKAMGAHNGMIAFQFFLEGILLSLLSIPFVGILVSLFVPGFNALMEADIPSNLFEDPNSLMGLIALAIGIGFLASLTPASYLGMRRVVSLFKEDWKQTNFQTFSVRKYMIVSQLVILIGMSSVSFLVSKQLEFVNQKDIGYKKEGVIFAYTSQDNIGYFQQKLRQIPGVIAVGNGSSFGTQVFNQGTYQIEGLETVFDDANQLYLDQEGYKAYDIKSTLTEIPAGRFTLINQTAAEKISRMKGIQPEDLIGAEVVTEPEYTDPETGQSGIPFTVSGIFEDIHLFSLHERMDPYFLTIQENLLMDGRSIISYDPTHEKKVISDVESVYAELKEVFPLELEFLSENLNNLYKQDKRTANLIHYFNVIAVFLSAIGIIGVSLFLTLARRKEFGIRKVLGASALSIVSTSTTEYVLMVGIALVIAWPAAYWIADTWLSNFAYRIPIQQWIFLVVGVVTLAFVSVLVGIVSHKAALENPAQSLKTE
ncbi:ABC transporter permease [Pararhodonellum marinum]|uniref:ABC transporter permease n=1 Tax=Pararhodonellum marinum TaxID=2755358 RepID=UPI001890B258|nr:ABC transporter permease [Pararhodonellum marinum]